VGKDVTLMLSRTHIETQFLRASGRKAVVHSIKDLFVEVKDKKCGNIRVLPCGFVSVSQSRLAEAK
jgi:hypothetical protein